MLKLREIMTTDMLTVGPETSVLDAMDLLGRRHVSGAPVVSGGKLVGVVTATDLMAFASSLSGVPTERETHDDWDVWGEESVEDEVEAEAEPASAFFSELWDDAGAETGERMSSLAGPEWNALAEHDVSEVMTRTPLVTLSPDADVEAAADLMRRDGIHRVLVTERDTLVGIVSALDIAKAAADRRLTHRTYVFNRDDDFADFR